MCVCVLCVVYVWYVCVVCVVYVWCVCVVCVCVCVCVCVLCVHECKCEWRSEAFELLDLELQMLAGLYHKLRPSARTARTPNH